MEKAGSVMGRKADPHFFGCGCERTPENTWTSPSTGQTRCKLHKELALQAWRDRNREKVRKQTREYNAAHPEMLKRWAEANKDKVREYQRKYREERREEAKRAAREYYQKNKEEISRKRREAREEAKRRMEG